VGGGSSGRSVLFMSCRTIQQNAFLKCAFLSTELSLQPRITPPPPHALLVHTSHTASLCIAAPCTPHLFWTLKPLRWSQACLAS
jgi:hypothetical protein